MKLKKAIIKDFKRFTDLTIEDIPETARLIMLVGPNGCGKSSFFDALYTWYKGTSQKNPLWEEGYHAKTGSHSVEQKNWNTAINKAINPEFHDSVPEEKKKALYVRSAYRNDPELQINSFQKTGDPLDEVRIRRLIDNDKAVSRNFERLVSQAIEDLFDPTNESKTVNQFKEEIIKDSALAFSKLFPKVKLNSLGDPFKDGTFRFTKGTSKGFEFKNLSGGEKAAFDLILDLVVARRSYDDTVFCIDEPESHMNARLQADLLYVLYELIPENCQLMLATHSIGMMRRAKDIEADNPGSVVFLSFGDLEFDEQQVIKPKIPDRTFWKKAYHVALDDLAALVAPKRVVICEGHPKTKNPVGNHSHDAQCYDRIFEARFPETRFVSMGNDREIAGDKRGLAEALLSLIDGLEVVRLIDRDSRSRNEIIELQKKGIRVLSLRNLESYLFDDEVLQALASSVNKEDKTDELLAAKSKILDDRDEVPSDDLKPVSGEIYLACKSMLDLTQCGNDTKTFMRDTLAPLIKPGMKVYNELKRDIFGSETEDLN